MTSNQLLSVRYPDNTDLSCRGMHLMSVGFPSVILWHVISPKVCRALPEASHFTCLWPSTINHHLALLPQQCDFCHPALSEVIAKNLFVVHWRRIVSVCRYSALSPIFHLCFPSSLALHHRVFLLSIRSMQEFSLGAVSFKCSMVKC